MVASASEFLKQKPSAAEFLSQRPSAAAFLGEKHKKDSSFVDRLGRGVRGLAKATVETFKPPTTVESAGRFLDPRAGQFGLSELLEKAGERVERGVTAAQEKLIEGPFAQKNPRTAAAFLTAQAVLAPADALKPSSLQRDVGAFAAFTGAGKVLGAAGRKLAPKFPKTAETLTRPRQIPFQDEIGAALNKLADFAKVRIAKLRGPAKPPIQSSSTSTFEKAVQGQVDKLSSDVTEVLGRVDGLNQRAKIAVSEAETIARTGTLPQQQRIPFREAGKKPETFNTRIAEADVKATQQQIVGIAREINDLKRRLVSEADPLSANTIRSIDDQMQKAVRLAEKAAKDFTKQRFASGRTVRAFNDPIPPEVAETLKEVGILLPGLKSVRQRLPLYNNIWRSLKEFPNLTGGEKLQFARDLVDAWRLNLFSVTSWTLDLIGNASELGVQAVGGISRDLGHVVQGKLTFPSIQGFFRAVRNREKFSLPARAEQAFGARVVSGELIPGSTFSSGAGTFTTRSSLGGKALDFLVGSPLYAKGAIDRGARRFSGFAHLWRFAIEEADKLGLKGIKRQQFYDDFFKNTPDDAVQFAIEMGNKAGFNRQLSKWEEAIAGSTTFRLLGSAFARWPFQFSRTMAEWLGYNPKLMNKFIKGESSVPEVFEYLGKSATGWGGLKLLDDGLYDRIDFNSMEYVHENGNRTRLAGREPIPSMLWFLATIKRDKAKSTAALRHASIPFAGLISGDGGLLTSTLEQLRFASKNARILPRALKREVDSMINRLFPGQAILSAVKTVFDPVIREGLGANLPGISKLLPPAINAATGEPLAPRQKILGVETRSIGGVPIPGAQRLLDPVTQLLSRFGKLIFRGPRAPIAGIPPSDIPEDLRREWVTEFGKRRNQLLLPLATRDDLNTLNPDKVRKRIEDADRKASKKATRIIERKFGKSRKKKRTLTTRERRLPTVFQRPEKKSAEEFLRRQ